MPGPHKIAAVHFDSEVMCASGVVLVDFYADWCGPCKLMKGIVEDLVRDLAGRARVCAVDVDEEEALAQRFSVTSVPSFLLFRNGSVLRTMVGYMPKEKLLRAVEEALAP
ncbi:MAG: thioredoxin domain-containing protein [Planctomycetota bacterium]